MLILQHKRAHSSLAKLSAVRQPKRFYQRFSLSKIKEGTQHRHVLFNVTLESYPSPSCQCVQPAHRVGDHTIVTCAGDEEVRVRDLEHDAIVTVFRWSTAC